MPIAHLIDDRGEERDYQLQDGRVITLKYNEDDPIYINFFDAAGKQLGPNFDFNFIQDDFRPGHYLLGRMYVPIKHMGLGRAAIQFFKDMTDATVYTRANDGIVRDDGTHLTEDAPSFVARMQTEGLIEDVSDCSYEDDHWQDD